MTDSPRDVPSAPPTDETAPKRPWHAPSLEEVDYADTQGGGDPAATYDSPTYAS